MLTSLPFWSRQGLGSFSFLRTHPNLGLKCTASPGQTTQHMSGANTSILIIFRFWKYPIFGQIFIQLNQSLYKDHNITSKNHGWCNGSFKHGPKFTGYQWFRNYTHLCWVRSATQSVCLAEPKFYSLLLNKKNNHLWIYTPIKVYSNKSDDSRHTPSLFRGNFGLVKRRLC